MKRRNFIKLIGSSTLATMITPTGVIYIYGNPPLSCSELEKGFCIPPDSSRPYTFWFWMNGNVTKEGITSDLEAIKDVGIGGVLNFDAGTGMIKGPVEYASPQYWELKKHAINECQRLNLSFGMHNCPGWSSSGGPWVTPEYSMLEIIWSEAFVNGGSPLKIQLPMPYHRKNFYRDICILAFPSLKGESPLKNLLRRVSSNKGEVNIEQLDNNPVGITLIGNENNKEAYLQFEFKEPYEITSLSFFIRSTDRAEEIKLEASMDGVHFNNMTILDQKDEYADNLEERSFKLIQFKKQKLMYLKLTATQGQNLSMFRFSEAEYIPGWKAKANYEWGNTNIPFLYEVPQSSVIDPSTIINLTNQMDSEGNFVWDVPSGNWTILRLGYTTKGTMNRAAPAGGEGLEIDKYSKEAMNMHFTAMLEQLIPTMLPYAKKGKVFLEIDSWEVGLQNWTPKFPEEFHKRAGYNLINYLPTLTGRIVKSSETSNRFLWDFRRIQADLIADNYYGHFNELCKKYGFHSYNEPYENGPFEELQIGSRVDVSIGEFWAGLSTLIQHNYEHRRTVRLCASIAHTWGRKIVGAESFTAEPPSGKWQQYPFALKALGDKYFTEGLTRIVFHRYAMQPHPNSNIAPGMTMAYWGMHFDRTNTWWEHGREWLNYLSRCQYLLQQGLFVADFAYFSGEDAPLHTTVFRDELHPAPPEGYDYDLVNKEVILTQMEIKNGRIFLPDGMNYQILVTQDFDTMSLELVQKLNELVSKGMILVGAKPKRTPGLGKQSGDDAAMLRLANELWGPIDGKLITEHQLGKGRVFWGESMDSILNKLSLENDFECTSRSGDAPIRYIHRKTKEADIYFICNERRQYEDLICTFRVAGKQPEFWSATDGKRFKAVFYEVNQGRTTIPIHLKPYGSLFIIFRASVNTHFKKLESQERCLFQTNPFPKVMQIKYKDVIDNFSICLWAKPEIDIMLESGFEKYREWTEYYAIYPPSGKELYGKGHETCGLTIGRNGVAIWHREEQWPILKWTFPGAIEGWTHIAVIYEEGVPSVYLNGKSVKRENKCKETQKKIIHPGLGKAFLQDGASYYNGDISKIQLIKKVINENEIRDQMIITKKEIQGEITIEAQIDEGDVPAILFMKNGNYRLTDINGHSKILKITEVDNPIELSGEWIVRFPFGQGAPEQIKLPKLISLHKHDIEGVRYFSGIATYIKKFYIEKTMLKKNKHLFLDLGRVEVSAEVFLNGKALGILWTRPYQVEITSIVKEGENNLLVHVANLWPNRLIGDEQLPPEYEYDPFQNYFGACIKEMPEWYLKGDPKPQGERVAFATWQHYQKNDPLLESGLIGPVVIKSAIRQKIKIKDNEKM